MITFTLIAISVVVIVLVLALAFILLKLKQLKKKKEEEEQKKKNIEKSISFEGKAKTPKESMIMLRDIAKKFFKDYFNEKREMTYLEMAEKLREKKKQKMAEFYEKMDYLFYSGINISKKDALEMIEEFDNIVKEAKR
jgi:ABC-type anion transport system duplicated permease subunit